MNFRRILSKSSLRSSSSSGKGRPEEVSKLQSEVELLKQTIDSLKVSVESRDAAIGTLAREKEKIYVELKSAQRTNRNLHQQLVDERLQIYYDKTFTKLCDSPTSPHTASQNSLTFKILRMGILILNMR